MEKENINVLIVGGLGFIGSSLARYLLATGKCNVNILDKRKYDNAIKDNNLLVFDKTKTQELTREDDIEKFYVDDGMYIEPADVIFHFGEFSRVEKSLDGKENLLETIENNVIGTGALISKYIRDSQNSTFIYAGSSTRFSFAEAYKQSPYAFTKYINAELVKGLNKWFDYKTGIVYFYNVFGEGENAGDMGTVVEKFRQKYISDEKIVLYGGSQTRRFTYIGDVIKGLAKLVFDKRSREAIVGKEYHMVSPSVKEVSIYSLAKMFYDDERMIESRHMNPGCRMKSIDDKTLKSVSTYGTYEKTIEEYVKSIRARKEHGLL